MKTSKPALSKSDFRFRVKKEEKVESIHELVHPRIQTKTTNSPRSKNTSISLMLQMYSRENEVLFI
ncbi:hypothetical protein QO200_14635 [Flavobacterium sp. Arc3]|jgi:hypothetical protein|uniref:hypothetical protein n=1 Tax=unclassified Flavobacterium TaxID=196869 RepID=UPI00352C6578